MFIDVSRIRLFSCIVPVFLVVVLLIGCAKRLELPDLGPPLPYSARLELAPSVTGATTQYTESCGHIYDLHVGRVLEEALIEATHRLFKTVSIEGDQPKDAKEDFVIRVDLVQWSLKLTKDIVYDRVPAELNFSALVSIRDTSGKLIREPEVRSVWQERLRVEPLQKNCDYITTPLLENAAIDFAVKYSIATREVLAPTNRAAAAVQSGNVGQSAGPQAAPQTGQFSPAVVPVPLASSGAKPVPSSLSFKAIILDENSNLILEGGERIRLRVEVVNTGSSPVQNASASIAGTPALVNQFPASTIPVGPLQPGESKTIEFVAILPQSVQAQRAEIQVFLSDSSSGRALPPQTLSAALRPAGTKSDDVDIIPTAASGFHHPQTFLISIGLSAYRDPQIAARKFAALDAEMIASYLQSLGGIPAKNIRLIQDWKALRPDIEEALLDWLPPLVTGESVVLVYFAGHAMVAPSGEVFLVPYDGTPANTARLYPLKDFDAALARLKSKHTLFIFDGVVAKLGSDAKSKVAGPHWGATNSGGVRLIGLNSIGKGVESEKLRHGLFTYYLLRGLRGEADMNRNGEVTVGELAAYVEQKIPSAAKSLFNQEQRPLVTPTLRATDKIADLVLTKPATIQSASSP